MSKKNLLTAITIKNASCPPGGKSRRLYDGGGLALMLYPSGHKAWHMRIRGLNGKETLLTLGSLDSVSLKEARELRDVLTKERLLGKEPKFVLDKLRRNGKLTIAEVVTEYLAEKRSTWKNDTYRAEFNRANKYLIGFPFGAISADALTLEHIFDFATAMDEQDYKTQHKRVMSLLKRAYDLSHIKYGLDKIDLSTIHQFLAKHKPLHHACIEICDLPKLSKLVATSNCSLQAKLLFDFMFLTIQRDKEASQNTKDNVDTENKILTIPKELAKNGREHIIPLSPQVIRILKLAEVVARNSEYIFPSPRGNSNRPIARNTLGKLFRKMGLKGQMTAHGIRSVFSTEMHEKLDTSDSIIIEMILSHTDKDRVREAYNREKFIGRRREVLNVWGEIYAELTREHSCTEYVEKELIRLGLLSLD
ncbi:hypothetical protein BA893_05795 [Vibrio natriegens]|uniref:tyrosine-type recombinase/integrase n=1 Tax=Vibrio natriegens TaxID=691 RepID=UPI000803D39D|nr:site-specific integrase [Vibrio natriegens]ANQ21201.1 hypothetical protein BA893_05795 [Vibrio natriegens]